MSESVIFCEGYQDRAFWAGWLESLGCDNLGRRPAGMGRTGIGGWRGALRLLARVVVVGLAQLPSAGRRGGCRRGFVPAAIHVGRFFVDCDIGEDRGRPSRGGTGPAVACVERLNANPSLEERVPCVPLVRDIPLSNLTTITPSSHPSM